MPSRVRVKTARQFLDEQMSEDRLRIILPFPDMKLMPNKKTNRWDKMSATQSSRDTAYVYCRKQLYWLLNEKLVSVNLYITWFPPDKRARDFDSLLRASKPIIDGALVDTGILLDDSPKVIKCITLQMGDTDKTNPRTEIEIERVME